MSRKITNQVREHEEVYQERLTISLITDPEKEPLDKITITRSDSINLIFNFIRKYSGIYQPSFIPESLEDAYHKLVEDINYVVNASDVSPYYETNKNFQCFQDNNKLYYQTNDDNFYYLDGTNKDSVIKNNQISSARCISYKKFNNSFSLTGNDNDNEKYLGVNYNKTVPAVLMLTYEDGENTPLYSYFKSVDLEKGDVIDFKIKVKPKEDLQNIFQEHQPCLVLYTQEKVKEGILLRNSNFIQMKDNYFEWSVESFADNLGGKLIYNDKIRKPYALEIYVPSIRGSNSSPPIEWNESYTTIQDINKDDAEIIVTYTLLTFDD